MIDFDDKYTIRAADIEDAAELLGIYSYYVLNSAASFEYEPPSLEEFTARIAAATEKYPYLVVESENGLAGFAFAHPFRERRAYDYAAEVTIYIHPDDRHKGLGRELYAALEHGLGEMGVRGVYACIAVPDGEDERLRPDSPLFHEAMGYKLCGTFKNCGYKFGKWYTMVWMEKLIGEFTENPEPIIPYRETLKAAPTERKPLASYDNKQIRLTDRFGNVFYGEGCSFNEEWGMHVLNCEEPGIEVGLYSIFESDIVSIIEM